MFLGNRYRFQCGEAPATTGQVRLLESIASVLSARYQSIFESVSPEAVTLLFRGLSEDRYVAEFLSDGSNPEVIAEAIGVLRESSLITYENRRISTGVLLSDESGRACPECLPYAAPLVSIKSFHRLCDGLKTVFLVNRHGLLLDLVDIRQWCTNVAGTPLPAPSPNRYRSHAMATARKGLCLVLTPNGEIKIFSGGVQVFGFLEGRWKLTDSAEKYRVWREAAGDDQLAERIFTAALNLAEHRRGGLFVVLDDPDTARELVAPADLVTANTGQGKSRIHYLLRGRRVLDMEAPVLESIARVDGSIVLDRESRLLAFGAILRHGSGDYEAASVEGGRTTAAIAASRYGLALKISEDGLVAFYQAGACVWEI